MGSYSFRERFRCQIEKLMVFMLPSFVRKSGFKRIETKGFLSPHSYII